jgi:hypothetical protein
VFPLSNKGKLWATLKLISSAASKKQLPTYYQREHITGTLEMNLEKEDTILAVTVQVCALLFINAVPFVNNCSR